MYRRKRLYLCDFFTNDRELWPAKFILCQNERTCQVSRSKVEKLSSRHTNRERDTQRSDCCAGSLQSGAVVRLVERDDLTMRCLTAADVGRRLTRRTACCLDDYVDIHRLTKTTRYDELDALTDLQSLDHDLTATMTIVTRCRPNGTWHYWPAVEL